MTPYPDAFPSTHSALAHQFDGFPPQLPLVPLVRSVNVAFHWMELGLCSAVVHDDGLCRVCALTWQHLQEEGGDSSWPGGTISYFLDVVETGGVLSKAQCSGRTLTPEEELM